jgi:hypothetical protein
MSQHSKHRDASAQPAPRKKGAKLAPSRMPRREEATDESIGKGEEPMRPRRKH